MINSRNNLENFIHYYVKGIHKDLLQRLKEDVDRSYKDDCDGIHPVSKLFRVYRPQHCYSDVENVFKELDRKSRLDNIKNYNDFCKCVLNYYIEEYELLGYKCVINVTNQFVVDILNSNICTPKKYSELCSKAFKTICNRPITKNEVKILVHRGSYLDNATDEVLTCIDTVDSYLELLNLITQPRAIEKYYKYLQEHPKYILNNYSEIRCNLNIFTSSFKDCVLKALDTIDDETKHSLDVDLVKSISEYNIIARHNGDITLVIDNKRTGNYTLCGKTYQFMSTELYTHLQELNLLDVNKYSRVIVEPCKS